MNPLCRIVGWKFIVFLFHLMVNDFYVFSRSFFIKYFSVHYEGDGQNLCYMKTKQCGLFVKPAILLLYM